MHASPLVLVVDDDLDITYLLGLMLSDAGYHVEEETSLAGVERRLAADPLPALVVLDVKLGAEDATLFVEHLRGQERTAHLPVLLISARVDVTTMVQNGTTTGLAKPFGARQLLESVARTLGCAAAS